MKETTVNERPKVGVGVLIIKDNKILLGKRKNSWSRILGASWRSFGI